MSRTLSIFGFKKGWFGNISKKFVADIFVKEGRLVVEAINDNIKTEITTAIQDWEKKYGAPYFFSGDEVADKDGTKTHRTFTVRQSIKDKEYVDAIASAVLMKKTFAGYYVRGYRIMEGDEKIMDIGVLK